MLLEANSAIIGLMKLIKIEIENYKLIDDSEEFPIRQLTCLVGKNEAGKTATLKALYKLNPIYSEQFDVTADYPRNKLSAYRRKIQDGEENDNVLTTKWELDSSELKILTDSFGTDCFRSNVVEIRMGYDNEQVWGFDIDHKVLIKHLLQSSGLFAEEQKELENIKVTSDLIGSLKKIDSPSDSQSVFITSLKQQFPTGTATHKAQNLLQSKLPKFVYFSNYSRMPGIVSLDIIKSKMNSNTLDENDKVFLALLDSVNTTTDEIQNMPKFEELKAELEGISNEISNKIFSYWSQNPYLEVEFSLDQGRPQDLPPFNSGMIFRTRIRNTRHKVTVPFDERSTGFVWFFSFLIWFSQVKKQYGENLIILLDEPGLSLHAKAQEDLLRYLRKELVPYHQVFYTTHSPFMVDQDLENVRTVEDSITKEGKLLGTKVSNKIFSTDSDTLFPLQAALGYNLTQNLFVGKNTLLVEGPSDLIYLKWFSRELEKQGKKGLNKNWVITPCGGLDKVGSFVALFNGNNLNIAVLTDFHKGDKAKVKNLQESELLKLGHVFSAEMYTEKSESDIEDVIGYENYVELVNECYDLKAKNKITIKTNGQSERVLEDVENHFRTLPSDVPEFDHYTPSAYLNEHGVDLVTKLPKFEEALARFEFFFQDINALLEK